MSTTTSNLGLTKPELDENFQLSVWNGNTDIIDTWAGQTNTALAGKQAELTTAQIAAANSGITAAKLTADEGALTALVDSGGKNLMKLTGEDVTGYGVSCVFDAAAGTITLDGVNQDKKCTGSFNIQIADPANMGLQEGAEYHIECAGTSDETFGIYIYKSGVTPLSQWDSYDHQNAAWNPAWLTANGFRLFIRSGAVVDNVVLKPMVCSSADWAISQEIKPYCPTLAELYAMVLAMQ